LHRGQYRSELRRSPRWGRRREWPSPVWRRPS
jgi:hypothetical protein